MTATERAKNGYTVTEFKTTDGVKIYGVKWYDNGDHIVRFDTPEAAELYAERICRLDKGTCRVCRHWQCEAGHDIGTCKKQPARSSQTVSASWRCSQHERRTHEANG
jgi:hypothetical protein